MYATVQAHRQEHRGVRQTVQRHRFALGNGRRDRGGGRIPLVWIWIASKLAGTNRDLTPSLAVFIATGIIVSYWLALLVGSWIRGRTVDPGEERAR